MTGNAVAHCTGPPPRLRARMVERWGGAGHVDLTSITDLGHSLERSPIEGFTSPQGRVLRKIGFRQLLKTKLVEVRVSLRL